MNVLMPTAAHTMSQPVREMPCGRAWQSLPQPPITPALRISFRSRLSPCSPICTQGLQSENSLCETWKSENGEASAEATSTEANMVCFRCGGVCRRRRD